MLGLDTLSDCKPIFNQNDPTVNDFSPKGKQNTPSFDVAKHVENDGIMGETTRLSTPDIQECFEEDVSMSLINVAIAVGKHRVRVPIQVFKDSELFYPIVKRAILNHGLNTEPLLKLDFLTSEQDFEDLWSFLKFLNPRRVTGEILFTVADYSALLRFSTKWRFNAIRDITIQHFPHADLVNTIFLAREHCVGRWLVTALNKYARLPRSITIQDVECLGSDYILKLVEVRDTMRRASSAPCGNEFIFWTEIDRRTQCNPRDYLTSLFAKDIELLSVEAPPIEPVAADDDYCLTEIYILVEDCIFQSYRELFEVSPLFRDMFSLPIQSNGVPDGSTKAQPLRIDGIKKADFKPFVALINPRSYPTIPFSMPAWISILKLSTMWDFHAIRRLAIESMSIQKLTPLQRICLAREHRIAAWLIPALTAYTQQRQPLTCEDVVYLGWDYILRILQARECVGKLVTGGDFYTLPCLHGQNCGQRHGMTVTPGMNIRSMYDFTPEIRRVFQNEIERIHSGEQSLLGTK